MKLTEANRHTALIGCREEHGFVIVGGDIISVHQVDGDVSGFGQLFEGRGKRDKRPNHSDRLVLDFVFVARIELAILLSFRAASRFARQLNSTTPILVWVPNFDCDPYEIVSK